MKVLSSVQQVFGPLLNPNIHPRIRNYFLRSFLPLVLLVIVPSAIYIKENINELMNVTQPIYVIATWTLGIVKCVSFVWHRKTIRNIIDAFQANADRSEWRQSQRRSEVIAFFISRGGSSGKETLSKRRADFKWNLQEVGVDHFSQQFHFVFHAVDVFDVPFPPRELQEWDEIPAVQIQVNDRRLRIDANPIRMCISFQCPIFGPQPIAAFRDLVFHHNPQRSGDNLRVLRSPIVLYCGVCARRRLLERPTSVF